MQAIGDFYVAPGAVVTGDVQLSPGVNIWFGSVLRGDLARIRLGPRVNIQDGCIVHTDYDQPQDIAEGVVVGHRAVLHGCTVEDHCLIGMGAILLNNVKVGEGSIIAAGALVPENTVIPARSLYMGVPAQFKRQLTDAERRFIDGHASHYVGYKEVYLSEQPSAFSSQQPASTLKADR